LVDDANAIARKIRKAKTDPETLPGTPDGLADRPEAANLLGIYAALADRDLADVCAGFEGCSFSAFKGDLADLAVAVLEPMAQEMRRLAADPAYVDSLLRDGADRAAAIAEPILRQVEDVVGFLHP